MVLAHQAHVWDYYLLDGVTSSCNEYGTAKAPYTEQPNRIPAAPNTWSRSLLLSDALVFAYIYKGQCVSGARGSSFSSRGGPAQAASGPSARVPPSSARAKEPAYGRHPSSPSRQAGGTLLLVIDVHLGSAAERNSGASSRRASKERERWSALHPLVRTEHR